jgi:hypothetical protein
MIVSGELVRLVLFLNSNLVFFRNWELMTLGTIVVLEKNVGLDRTVIFPVTVFCLTSHVSFLIYFGCPVP